MDKIIKVIVILIPIGFACLFITNMVRSYHEEAAKVAAMPPSGPPLPSVKSKETIDNKWYTIERDSGKCHPSDSPAEMIKALRAGIKPYETIDEVVEGGIAMQVRFIFQEPDGAYQLTYYRGKERCKEESAKRKSQAEAELSRYK